MRWATSRCEITMFLSLEVSGGLHGFMGWKQLGGGHAKGCGSSRQVPTFSSKGLKISLIYMIANDREGYGPTVGG